jgi:hypothetical protein
MAHVKAHVLTKEIADFMDMVDFSITSMHFITKELFQVKNDHYVERFLKEHTNDKQGFEPTKFLGAPLETEFQLFVIRDCLSKRIDGTRKRMNEEDIPEPWEESAIVAYNDLFVKRRERCNELLNEYKAVYRLLNTLLLKRFASKVTPLIIKGDLMRHLYLHSTLHDSDGIDFVFVSPDKIFVRNRHIPGGD